MKTNDGGLAFPMQFADIQSQRGMSLRDYFAGQALAGIIMANPKSYAQCSAANATKAYNLADAMLAAREPQ